MRKTGERHPIWQVLAAVMSAPVLIAILAAVIAGTLSLPEIAFDTGLRVGGFMLALGLLAAALFGVPLALWQLRARNAGILRWMAAGAVAGLAAGLVAIAFLAGTASIGSMVSLSVFLALPLVFGIGVGGISAAMAWGLLQVIVNAGR